MTETTLRSLLCVLIEQKVALIRHHYNKIINIPTETLTVSPGLSSGLLMTLLNFMVLFISSCIVTGAFWLLYSYKS